MEAHSEIKPHYGETDAVYRCHLPLVVPASLPVTGFQVGYEQRSWEEGKLLAFNDAAYHKGWNTSDKERIVLIFDVIRPELLPRAKRICATAHANIELHKKLSQHPQLRARSRKYLIFLRNLIAFKFWFRFQFEGVELRA
jgi:aspartyl/asparaginyl beta-hydroxylase (cupin superfamily)